MQGGEILAYGGSAPLCWRANEKKTTVLPFKYPEDEVQHYIDGAPLPDFGGRKLFLASMRRNKPISLPLPTARSCA